MPRRDTNRLFLLSVHAEVDEIVSRRQQHKKLFTSLKDEDDDLATIPSAVMSSITSSKKKRATATTTTATTAFVPRRAVSAAYGYQAILSAKRAAHDSDVCLFEVSWDDGSKTWEPRTSFSRADTSATQRMTALECALVTRVCGKRMRDRDSKA